jgi:hypothetical protein
MVEAAADYAIIMLDPDGLVATWNRRAERIKGYQTDNIKLQLERKSEHTVRIEFAFLKKSPLSAARRNRSN